MTDIIVLPDTGRWTLYTLGLMGTSKLDNVIKTNKIECYGTGAMITLFVSIGFTIPEIATLFQQTHLHHGVSPLSLSPSDNHSLSLSEISDQLHQAIEYRLGYIPTLIELEGITENSINFISLSCDGTNMDIDVINSLTYPNVNCVEAILFTLPSQLAEGQLEYGEKYYFSPLGFYDHDNTYTVCGNVESSNIEVHHYNMLCKQKYKPKHYIEDKYTEETNVSKWDAMMYLKGIKNNMNVT